MLNSRVCSVMWLGHADLRSDLQGLKSHNVTKRHKNATAGRHRRQSASAVMILAYLPTPDQDELGRIETLT